MRSLKLMNSHLNHLTETSLVQGLESFEDLVAVKAQGETTSQLRNTSVGHEHRDGGRKVLCRGSSSGLCSVWCLW